MRECGSSPLGVDLGAGAGGIVPESLVVVLRGSVDLVIEDPVALGRPCGAEGVSVPLSEPRFLDTICPRPQPSRGWRRPTYCQRPVCLC